ncbi:Xenotropic and polytropic retrovirus receptor 1 [Coelomomyces lativittatus]|nr:Xenotropic and polytropic retrovirus receptor 1 [Coelomomyces lativittatus]KAJ1503151.1 Xenotropic and polytropic retrovirus receptor 1 [Coelomomyces lativittatus]
MQIRAQSNQPLNNNDTSKISRLLPVHTTIPGLKFKKNQLKDAMLEFYRGLSLLRNFQIVNYTGLIKILKKFDKSVGWTSSAIFLKSRKGKLFWECDNSIQELAKETEHTYCKCFTGGKRQKGMQQLRLPELGANTYQTVTWISGFFLGVGLILLVLALVDIAQYEAYKSEYFITLTQVYGGFFMPIFFSIALVYVLFLWSTHAINYTFIFELDPRDHIHYLEFLLFPSFLFCLWSLFFFLNFTHHSEALSLHPFLLPLVYFCICVLVFFNPLPIFYRNARFWFLRATARILLSPFHKISFSDFFLTDILCSLLFSLTCIPLFLCVSFRQDPQCDTSKSLSTFSFALIPPMLRLIQCFRRFYDSSLKHPHLTNSLKYLLSCLVILTSFRWRVTDQLAWFSLWIFTSVVATIFAIVWDMLMDWGVLRFKHALLREQLTLAPPWVYYLAIIANGVLRLGWVLQMSPGYWLPTPAISAATLVCAFLESLRRVQWCLFRMENEHLYNCGQFRAVKDIPLPRPSRIDEEDLMEMKTPPNSPPNMPSIAESAPSI